MNPCLSGATLTSSWAVVAQGALSGALELYLTAAGYVWNWRGRPAEMVPLVGVLDDRSSADQKPLRFVEMENALAHVMHCTAIAFNGDCGLAAEG